MKIIGGLLVSLIYACKREYCFNSLVVYSSFGKLISVILLFVLLNKGDDQGLTENTEKENNDNHSEEEDSEDYETDEELELSTNGQPLVDASSSTR